MPAYVELAESTVDGLGHDIKESFFLEWRLFCLQSSECKKQTSYILQFLWRDLTSEFDIVGPYFTSSSTVESKFVLACVFETVKLFQFHGLMTGPAAPNLQPSDLRS